MRPGPIVLAWRGVIHRHHAPSGTWRDMLWGNMIHTPVSMSVVTGPNKKREISLDGYYRYLDVGKEVTVIYDPKDFKNMAILECN